MKIKLGKGALCRGTAPAAGLLVLVTCFAAFALTAVPAGAKVSGTNGRIAFARDDPALGDTVTYTANPDGSHMQPLLPGFTSGSPHWSPDGSEVAVNSSLGLPCCDFPYSAVIINPDTGSFHTLAMQDPNVATFCSIWSPDATRLACIGDSPDESVRGVYTIRSSDGGGLTRITNAGGASDVPIDYSPDGTKIVFGRVDPEDHHCTTRSALYVVNTDGSGLHRITPWGFCDDDGSWSPDGTMIAFASGKRLGKIYVVHPDGTGLMQIPIPVSGMSGLGDVSWSPDGTKMAFLLGTGRGPGTGQEGIYTANANGTDLQQVTSSPTFDHQPDWGTHPRVK
jgi:Tol biopolymer transport system component